MADALIDVSSRPIRPAELVRDTYWQGSAAGYLFLTPWLIGFILRELDLENKTLGQVAGLAADVVKSLPSVKGNTPATLIQDGRIICGYIQRELLEF